MVLGRAEPGTRCSDEVYLRRVYIDLVGRIPRLSEARDFLASTDVNRRALLVDQLVQHPSHATRLTNRWRMFLLPLEEDG